MEKARFGEHRRPPSRSGQATRPTQAIGYVNNHSDAIAHSRLADAIQHSPFLTTQRQRFGGMFGGTAQLKAGQAVTQLAELKLVQLRFRVVHQALVRIRT